MTHWLDKVEAIFNAQTNDLRQLAKMAGKDPKTFYLGVKMDGVDIRGQDLRGMRFTDFDASKAIVDDKTILPAPPPVNPKMQKEAEEKAESLLKQNRAVPDDVAENVRALNLDFSDFKDMQLLANFKWLQRLWLRNCEVNDFQVLEGMMQMQTLFLSRTQVSDIGVLRGMVELKEVWAHGLAIADWSPVDHVDDVRSRPDDWVRKKGWGFW